MSVAETQLLAHYRIQTTSTLAGAASRPVLAMIAAVNVARQTHLHSDKIATMRAIAWRRSNVLCRIIANRFITIGPRWMLIKEQNIGYPHWSYLCTRSIPINIIWQEYIWHLFDISIVKLKIVFLRSIENICIIYIWIGCLYLFLLLFLYRFLYFHHLIHALRGHKLCHRLS